MRQATANSAAEYKNYVCVSRERVYGADGGLVESSAPTSAYVDFNVAGDLSATVTDFTVTRAYTDADGIPTGEKSVMRVFGSPVGKALSAVNDAYVMLDFSGGADRYYALDVAIKLSRPAEFTFTATAKHFDEHENYRKDTFYLGMDGNGANSFLGREPVEMTALFGDAHAIDRSVIMTLPAGGMFKMFKATADGTRDGAVWCSASSAISTPQGGITASVVNNGTQDNGNVKLTGPAGRYLVRYYGNDQSGTQANVQMILVEHVAGMGSELAAPEDGYYVVGSFSEFKIFDGNRMTPSENCAGIFEFAVPQGTRYTPVYSVAKVAGGKITYSEPKVAARGETVYYDAFTGSVGVDPNAFYRIIFDSTKPNNYGDFSDFRIYYWNDALNKNNGWTNRGEAMKLCPVDNKYYYFDIAATGNYTALTGTIIFLKEYSSQYASLDAIPSGGYIKGNSYLIKFVAYKEEGWDKALGYIVKRNTITCEKSTLR